ncbi:MAG: phenylalanine--tRNA ligase subunit beta [Planctomycetota bacterium]
MYTSSAWMNDYLDPPADADEQAELLTRAGFPLEGREPLSGSDVRQDYEMTSNRGDCICHVGLAREIAAISRRALKTPRPALTASGPPAGLDVAVTNLEPKLCPLYTARIIRGVTVRSSPGWMTDRLQAINLIPRNNIVDASNFVLFELGQPTHVFDLAKLAGPQIIIRLAEGGERFLPIGEGAEETTLTGHDLVIADARVPVAIAGVKGGAVTAVTSATTDILIEAATFDPVAVRNTSRRLNVESDSSYRFERGVHPGQVNAAAERLAEIILDVAGGELAEGVVFDGAPIPQLAQVSMRPDRCRALMGVPIETEQMVEWLTRLELQPRVVEGLIQCVVPAHRLDLEREIDLIEEVGRMMGHDTLPVRETIEIRLAPPQGTELGRRALCETLVGMGFVETVTHSLIGKQAAEVFLLPGTEALWLEGEAAGRSQADSVLQPSLLPGLLRVLAHNHDSGVHHLMLFETAPAFVRSGEDHREQRMLALVADLDHFDDGLRPLRGVVERLAEQLLGPGTDVVVEPDDTAPWLAPGAVVGIGGRTVGRIGVLATEVGRTLGLDTPVAMAELELEPLIEHYPPQTQAHALPAFPAVERDISAIVDEGVSWRQLRAAIEDQGLEHLEAIEFVAAFRGKQIGPGRKTITVRLRFRAPDSTLVHDAVDVQANAAMKALEAGLGAEIRK